MTKTKCPRILKYSNNHLWLLIKEDHAFVGITAFAQQQIEAITSIHINKNESILPQHAEFGYVTGKNEKILELIMPFNGKIKRTNIDLLRDPRRINTAPYMAWIVYFKITDKEGVKDLMTAYGYKKLLNNKTELTRNIIT